MSELATRLERALRDAGHRTVISGAFGSVDGHALRQLSVDFARRSASMGIGPGDAVACIARPGPRMFALLAALMGRGATVVLGDPRVGADVLAAHLAAAGVTHIVAEPALWRLNRLAPRRALRMGLRVSSGAAARWSLGSGILTGAMPFRPLTTGPVAPSAPGAELVIFTSGSVDAPRGVVHTTASLSAGVDAVIGLIDPRPGAAVAGNQFFVLLPALCAGASVMLLTGDAGRDVALLQRLRPEVTYLTPPALQRVLAAGGPVARMYGRVFTGSTPVSAHLLRAAKAAGADQAWDVYALTEAFPVSAIEADQKAAWSEPGDIVGAPVPGVTARVDDDGQLCISGPNVASRYLAGSPCAEIPTGDRARLAAGAIVLDGRMKDMFLTDADNVYPGLYEPMLRVPGVAEVLLVGVGADPGNQQPVLVVERAADASEAEVRRRLAPQLERMGRARPVAVVFAEVPRSGRNAKPDRAAAEALAGTLLSR